MSFDLDRELDVIERAALTKRMASILRLYQMTYPDHAAELLLREYDETNSGAEVAAARDRIRQEFTRLQQEIEDLELVTAEEITKGDVKRTHETLEARIAELETEVTRLQRGVMVAESETSSLRSIEKALEDRIAELEADLIESRQYRDIQGTAYEGRIAELHAQLLRAQQEIKSR